LLALARSAPHPLLLFALAYFTEFGKCLRVRMRTFSHCVCISLKLSCVVSHHRGHVPADYGRGRTARHLGGVPEPAASSAV
jgi:hypothetical protein